MFRNGDDEFDADYIDVSEFAEQQPDEDVELDDNEGEDDGN